MEAYNLKKILVVIILTFNSNTLLSDDVSPEAIAQSYFSHIENKEFKNSVKFVHPDELNELKESVLNSKDIPNKNEAAESILHNFYNISKPEDLLNLSNEEYYIKYLENQNTPRTGMYSGYVSKNKVIGSVIEGNFAYVAYRNRVFTDIVSTETIELIKLKRYKDSWGTIIPKLTKILLTP